MKKLRSLSVFFPAYNDAKIIPYLIAKTYVLLPQIAKKYEVLVINDGSIDETSEVLKHLKKQYAYLRVIEHKKNKGYGGALHSGFQHARHEWIFYTDGDGQYDPSEIIKLVKKVSNKVDVVNGYKIKRSDPVIRTITGSIYNGILHLIYRLPIRDIDCDFRLIRTSLVKKIKLTSSSGTICLELIEKLRKQGAKFREVPVQHYKRPIGNSQFFKPPHLLRTLRENVDYFKRRNG